MLKEVIRAQAETLDEWATQWDRDAIAGPIPEGYNEVVFLMRRLSRKMLGLIGDVPPEMKEPPPPVAVADAREG